MRLRRHRWVRLLLPVLMLLSAGPPVRAADERPFQDPSINYADRSTQYVQWIAGTLFIAACVLVAIKNPHRSHLD